jgi:hypothetical protein
MLKVADKYGFEAGRAYNLVSDEYIRYGNGPAGAHNDIAHAEVAHAYWQAIPAAG